MDEERLVDIEMRLAFQEDTIERLNDVICRQQELLDRLLARCDMLGTRVRELADKLPDEGGGDERPPHY
ncbi:SlyX family protein [Porticoccus sp.]